MDSNVRAVYAIGPSGSGKSWLLNRLSGSGVAQFQESLNPQVPCTREIVCKQSEPIQIINASGQLLSQLSLNLIDSPGLSNLGVDDPNKLTLFDSLLAPLVDLPIDHLLIVIKHEQLSPSTIGYLCLLNSCLGKYFASPNCPTSVTLVVNQISSLMKPIDVANYVKNEVRKYLKLKNMSYIAIGINESIQGRKFKLLKLDDERGTFEMFYVNYLELQHERSAIKAELSNEELAVEQQKLLGYAAFKEKYLNEYRSLRKKAEAIAELEYQIDKETRSVNSKQFYNQTIYIIASVLAVIGALILILLILFIMPMAIGIPLFASLFFIAILISLWAILRDRALVRNRYDLSEKVERAKRQNKLTDQQRHDLEERIRRIERKLADLANYEQLLDQARTRN